MNEIIYQTIRFNFPQLSARSSRELADAIEARLIETCWHTPTAMFSQSEITRAAE